jgi:uncharacterized protein YkwD
MSRGVTVATAVVVLLGCWVGSAGPAAAQAGCARAAAATKSDTLTQSNDAVLCLINTERTRRGLRAVRLSAPLSSAALAHSADMVAQDYFDHVSPDGTTARQRVLKSGYFTGSPGWVDEALAMGWQARSSPQQFVRMLMNSRVHRSILLNRGARDVGIGLVVGAPTIDMPGGATLTLDFARR